MSWGHSRSWAVRTSCIIFPAWPGSVFGCGVRSAAWSISFTDTGTAARIRNNKNSDKSTLYKNLAGQDLIHHAGVYGYDKYRLYQRDCVKKGAIPFSLKSHSFVFTIVFLRCIISIVQESRMWMADGMVHMHKIRIFMQWYFSLTGSHRNCNLT